MVYTPGPFDREHGYVQWGGSLPGGETWSCGVRVAATEGIDVPNWLLLNSGWDYDALNQHYADVISAFHAKPEAQISARAVLEFVKFNGIGKNGRYIEQVTHEVTFPGVAGGVGGAGPHPPNQICMVVSLLTGFTRGPAHRGRFYLPMPAMAVGVTGMVGEGERNLLLTETQTLIAEMSDVPGADTAQSPGVVVMSRKLGAPATRRVTGVAIGRVLDTQRRRRRSLPEQYNEFFVDQGTF